MRELVEKLEKIVPTFAPDATASARAPYATYELSESPIRTSEGIAGYEGTLQISIYCATLAQLTALSSSVVSAIDNKWIGKRKYYYADSEGSDYPDIGLIAKTLSFNTLT